MLKCRKTDKYRLIERRGFGMFEEYKPWLKVHEFGSCGRVHRIVGWKNRRIHQLMSDLELYYFVLTQWDDNVIDIREQYPLLPLEETISIANEIGVNHPPMNSKKKTVMTTDFLINRKIDNKDIEFARAIKTQADIENPRTVKKLLIEKKYWENMKVDWGLVTEDCIHKTKAINIYSIYNDYFWEEENEYTKDEINLFIYQFKNILVQNNYNVLNTINDFERKSNIRNGEGLRLFKYLLVTKKIKTDMNIKFNFSTMNVWL